MKSTLKKIGGKFFNIILSSFQEQDGKGSGKRFSLFSCVFFLGWIVAFHTDKNNASTIATILSTLIGALAGVTVYQAINKK